MLFRSTPSIQDDDVRIAIASDGQETGSFSQVPTTLDTFAMYGH